MKLEVRRMPDIIDNVKVGEYIKQLLKKKNMTQDDLAQHLNISKAAVSQNLRGKSTFDINNLIAIANLFEITLDELLSLKTEESKETRSEYQKVVSQGLDAIKTVQPQDLHIAEPDLYGKVLVDYIIDQRKLSMLIYLIEHNVTLVHAYYHRAKQIYLHIIKYLLEEKRSEYQQFVTLYTEIVGSFKVEDEQLEMIIWGYLNQENHQGYIESILKNKTSLRTRLFAIKQENECIPFTRKDLLLVIAKYKLLTILDTLLTVQKRDDDFIEIVQLFLQHDFEEGIRYFIGKYYKSPITTFKKTLLDVQKGFLLAVQSNHLELVIDFASHGLFTDLTTITKEAIKCKHESIYSYLLANYSTEIIYKRIAETCIETNNLHLLESISSKLTKDDLNYLISWVKIDQMELLTYLLKKGARIDEKYYNLDTFKKINALIDSLLDKGSVSE